MTRRRMTMALFVVPLAATACGGGERAVRNPAAPSGRPAAAASSVRCDGALRQALEGKARAALPQLPFQEEGIVYTKTNSGCAMVRGALREPSRR